MRRDDDLDDGTRAQRRKPGPKFWLGAGFAILFVVFVLLNRTPVRVHYILFSKDSHLIWVMLICFALGFGVGWLWGRPGRREAKRRSDAPEKPRAD